MIGHNKISLNKATVIAALQMYLDAQLKEGRQVTVHDVEVLYNLENFATVSVEALTDVK